MEALIKFLKSFGLSDQEIKKVLQEVPVDQSGFAGTNISKGIFEKGGKQVSADYPLVTETMVSPFKLDKYKGLSRKETLEKAEEALKYLDKELTRTSNLIINQNLQLAPEQKINFSNNLRMKREFEKEIEAFKTQPEAKIIQLETKQPISKEGIEQLTKESGQINPPGTLAGDIETRVNRLKTIADKKGMNVGEILKETGEAQVKYAAGNDVGLLRSVARQIMFNDIKSGKLKAPKEIQDIVSGASNIDVIEPFRNIYGENALEQLDSLIPDFKNVATEIDAEKLARSKYEFTPKLDRPKESYTADEMEKILKGEEPPEKKAKGGRIGYAEGTSSKGLDYLTGEEPSEGYAKNAPSITLDTHEKASGNMDKYPVKIGNLELGIMGSMTSGNKYKPDPYNTITRSDRNISVKGKYNVPDTGVSLVGDIGDVRIKNTRDLNVPQYDYKETIKDIMRAKPYSVGIEYAPNENRNINLRYDDQGNIYLRGEQKFAKGGLSYLMGF
jgi:hypothetical protein